MAKLEENIFRLAQKVEEIDQKEIERIFEFYQNIPADWRDISKLREKLKEKKPYLFERDMVFADGIRVTEKEQTENKRKFFAKEGGNEGKIPIFKIIASLEKKRGDIAEIDQKLKSIFGIKEFEHSFRIKDLEKFGNGENCGLADIVGFRIVPKQSSRMAETISKFEKEFKNEIIFKLNTFPFNKKEIADIVGRNSSTYYRAIHYYLALGCLSVEIQIRTKGIDLWSKLHHDTIYKPEISVSRIDKNNIIRFGAIANITDYFEIAI